MTDKHIFDEAFPQYTQVGGNHYTKFPIQPYEFISKNDLSFFQGNVVKYVCRYQRKGGQRILKDNTLLPVRIKKNERHEE
ncbi:MAG: hypothetical protein CM15mV45_620 [uncultured marine virus]|nr:MAG: hypothetical protein CM15mV45_620 [uncultured marine virus]